MKMTIIVVLIALLVFFMLNNFINAVYQPMSCWINQFDCPYECDPWDGNCTAEIEDACCEDCIDVRMCEGVSFDEPFACEDRYCTTQGKKCFGEYNIATVKFDCKCVDTYSPPL